MKLDVALDELFPQPVDVVWGALTDAEAISDWLMVTSDFEPQVGVRFTLQRQTAGAGSISAEVLELDPPRRMVWGWSMGDGAAPTIVTFELMPDVDGTRLRLTHVGELEPSLVDLFRNGWPGRLELLARVAQRRNDGE